MKRLLILLSLLLAAVSLYAQVVVMDYDMFQNNRNIRVKLSLQDAKTAEPLAFATVYLNRQGDTTITHFALSDQKGAVEIKDVPVGRYRLNVEMIGYRPFARDCNFRNYEEDLGVVKLEENPEVIDAASITAIGNAVEIKQDTVIYNASAFHVGSNDMLEDLLKKMPGMEVAEDGTVKHNGEPVDKITVGGKTFFFNDPAAALKNLPAKIVDKIKVVDQDKKEAAFSGIASQDSREKVMDLELKEEFKQGWFGNAKLGGGYRQGRDEGGLSDDRHALFNGNFLLSGYNEKDQLTLIANGQNAPEPGSGMMIMVRTDENGNIGEIDPNALRDGLTTSAMGGANLNSDRIPGMNSSASVSYNFSDKVIGERSSRLSALVGEAPLSTDARTDLDLRSQRVSVNLELEKKDTKKTMFVFSPSFRFNTSHSDNRTQSATKGSGGSAVNGSEAVTSNDSRGFQASGRISGGLKDLGRARRNLTLTLNYNFNHSRGGSRENSVTRYGDTETLRDLRYDTGGSGSMLSGTLSYLEPFGDKWGLSVQFSPLWQQRGSDKAAFNADGSANDYYSTSSRTDYLLFRERLQMQYKWKPTAYFYFGAQLDQTRNEVRTRSLGRDTQTGVGEWLHDWSPYVTLRLSGDSGKSLTVSYQGSSNQVSGAQILPTPDISNPLYISTGNIYLRPTYRHQMTVSGSINNRKTFSYLSAYIFGYMMERSIVSASWFDPEGVRYSVPVNARKPQYTAHASLTWRQPLGKARRLTLNAWISGNVTGSTGYQASSRLPGMNLTAFDYNAFMADFWGDAHGSRFYSGQSGFAESRTLQTSFSASLGLTWRLDRFSASWDSDASYGRSRYSLDPSANTDTWNFSHSLDLLYETLHGWEFKTDVSYHHFLGYAAGFNDPFCLWNLSVSKNIKAFTLSLSVSDLLNQQRSRQHTVSAEYVQDSYSLVMGRYALFSIKWNFGKMNAARNARVQNAMFNML
ncbi:MAG: outer membrane beta-barrel protein [Bacteroidales bacterium]|nr:outer membrane beta-barrel protein [Bacteroidales bacterium]